MVITTPAHSMRITQNELQKWAIKLAEHNLVFQQTCILRQVPPLLWRWVSRLHDAMGADGINQLQQVPLTSVSILQISLSNPFSFPVGVVTSARNYNNHRCLNGNKLSRAKRIDVLLHHFLADSGGDLQENPGGAGRGWFEGKTKTDGVSFLSTLCCLCGCNLFN